mgnify:CR=1 FL=1
MKEEQTSVKHINQRIIGYAVKTHTGDIEIVEDPSLSGYQPIKMNETIGRPDVLYGSTYKIKIGAMEHALYVTVNDMILNAGTDHEERRPYELFVNSKNMTDFQWIVALTRLTSAVFRKGGDVAFMVEELKQVFDPQGGMWDKGTFYPSLVAKIGHTLEHHMKRIGMIKTEQLSDHHQSIIAEKLEAFQAKEGSVVEDDGYPKQATVCPKCHQRSMIRMDSCDTCINSDCAYSKCG